MSTIPPEYAQTHKDLQNAIDNPASISDQDTIDTLNKLSDQMSTPSSEDELLKDIDALAGAALDVDTSFDNITALFNKVQTSGVRPELASDVNRLLTAWQGHHATFTTLLWKSREVAGKAQGAADDFAKDFATFLADNSVSLADKKAEIGAYLEKLAKDEQSSQSMSQGFTDLRKNVEAFRDDWKRTLDNYNLDDIAQNIKELDETLSILNATLDDLNAKIRDLAIALGILAVSAGITAGLGFICPWFWVGTLFSVVGIGITATLLRAAMTERDDVEYRIKSTEKERGTEVATLEALKELRAGLDASQGDFNVIIVRLTTFAQVWAILRSDIQAIEEKLDYAVGSVTEGLFKSRLNTAATLYAALGKALYRYQNVVNKDNVLSARLTKLGINSDTL